MGMTLFEGLKSRAARTVAGGVGAFGLEIRRRGALERLRVENRHLKQALQQAICFSSLGDEERRLIRLQAGAETSVSVPEVSQIYLSDASAPKGGLLDFYAHTVRDCFVDSNYTLYGNQMIEDLLKEHFEPDVLWAYRALVPYAYRADLARYCIVYIKGGWYVDVGTRWVIPVRVSSGVDLLAFRDIQRRTRTAWACHNTAFYARSGHPALKRAIEIVVDHCKTGYYGITSLCPTGPNVWGQAIAEMGSDDGMRFGDTLQLTPDHPCKNEALVMPDGTICAFRKPSGGGDLAAIGGKGTNNYGDLWLKREVYRYDEG